MATRIVRGACPHDCPDTCAMHVTVEDGRAVKVAGDPDHPITVGFLCGKVSNYLDRVYSDERVLHPLVARRAAEFRRASWDEALDRVADGLSRARDELGGESILPYSYMGTQGLIQGDMMSARVMNALGATRPRADDLRHRRAHRDADDPRHLARGRPEDWPHARYVIVWGWNPMSTAPHLWRKLLDARGARRAAGRGRPLPQPHRARGRRAPAPAAGHRRRAGDRDDAGDRRRRAAGRGVVPRPRRGLRRAARATLARNRSRTARRSAACRPTTSRGSGREFATTRPALLRLGVGAQRHMGAPAAYRRSPRCRRSPAPGATAAAAAPTSRTATAAAVSDSRSSARTCGPGRCARSTCRSSARRSPTPRSTRRSRRSSAGTPTRRRSRPTRSACSRACAATTCSPSCSSSS